MTKSEKKVRDYIDSLRKARNAEIAHTMKFAGRLVNMSRRQMLNQLLLDGSVTFVRSVEDADAIKFKAAIKKLRI